MGEVGTVTWFGAGAGEGGISLGVGAGGGGGDEPVLERSRKAPGRSAAFPAASCGPDGTSVSDILVDVGCVVRAACHPRVNRDRRTRERGKEDGRDRWAMGALMH